MAGGIGPLLSRLGTALKSEGVNVADIVSIFHGETAVAIVPHARRPTLVIVARTADEARTRPSWPRSRCRSPSCSRPRASSSGSAPGVQRPHGRRGVTAHQLALTTGLQLDYAVFHGLVVISTSLQGITAVAQRPAGSLAAAPATGPSWAPRRAKVTSLVYADLGKLLSAGASTGLTTTLSAIAGDLRRVGAVGLTSVRGRAESTAQLSIQVPG